MLEGGEGKKEKKPVTPPSKNSLSLPPSLRSEFPTYRRRVIAHSRPRIFLWNRAIIIPPMCVCCFSFPFAVAPPSGT